MELANLAPTAANAQNRHFIIIRDKKIKREIYKTSCQQKHLLEAPVIIAVATNIRQFNLEFILKKIWKMDIWGTTPKAYKNNKIFFNNLERWKNIWPIQDADAAVTTRRQPTRNYLLAGSACLIPKKSRKPSGYRKIMR